MRSHVNEVLLLPLKLNSFFHPALLEIFRPFLLTDVRYATKDAFQHSLRVSFRISAHENPRVAPVSISVLPGRVESELEGNGFFVDNQFLPSFLNSGTVLIFDAVHPHICSR